METEKQMLLKQIAEMEQREKDNQKALEEMRKKVEKLEEEQPTVSATGVWLEQVRDKRYFFVDGIGEIKVHIFTNHSIDKSHIEVVNAFETEEQAEQEALRREGQEFIRRCAMLWNKDHDWRKDFSKNQYNIICSDQTLLFVGCSISTMCHSEVWFDTGELAEKCIAELKSKYNEEQIKTIFGVIE